MIADNVITNDLYLNTISINETAEQVFERLIIIVLYPISKTNKQLQYEPKNLWEVIRKIDYCYSQDLQYECGENLPFPAFANDYTQNRGKLM